MTPRAIGYIRLSRDQDDHDGRPIAEKLEDRAGQVRELAARYSLPLVDILRETESGVTIADRPVMRRLLEICRRRECSHILTPEQARVLRGDKRDEAEIEDTFAEAGITLVSHEGTLEFGSEEFDPLPYEVRALVARHEIRQYIKRRKRANAEKLRQNKRYGGPMPYGYADNLYTPDPATYPVLCRILTDHLAGKSLNRLMIELTDEGVPSPKGRKWSRTTIRSIVLNPVYGGRHAQQLRVIRINGKRHVRPIPITDWIIADVPGEWEHPITFEQWLSLRNRYASTSKVYYPVALLSGMLYCQAGHPMISSGERAYTCIVTPRHLGMSVNKPRMEQYVYECIAAVLQSIPVERWGPVSEPVDREALQKDYDRALRLAQDAAAAHDDLLSRALYYQRLFEMDADKFAATVQKRATEKRAAADALAEVQARMMEPHSEDVKPLLEAAREIGFPAIWESCDTTERRRFTALFVERVDVCPTLRGAHARGAVIRWWDWVLPFLPAAMPEYRRRGNVGNGPGKALKLPGV